MQSHQVHYWHFMVSTVHRISWPTQNELRGIPVDFYLSAFISREGGVSLVICLLIFIFVLCLDVVFFFFLFSFICSEKGKLKVVWVRRWGGCGRNWWRENHDQNVFHDVVLLLQNKDKKQKEIKPVKMKTLSQTLPSMGNYYPDLW